MSSRISGRIGEQHDAYRKGLVLGLTMGELGILIIFVLLLLIALQELRRQSEQQAIQQQVHVDPGRFTQLKDAESELQELAKAMSLKARKPDDDFKKLIRVLAETAATPEGQKNLTEAQQSLAQMKEATRNAEKLVAKAGEPGAKGVARELEAQSFRLANQEGQLKRYEDQLREVGKGKGERPCWVQPDGKIDYLYDVVLTSDGIRMREYRYPSREVERALLPMPVVEPQEVLTEYEFLRRTAPLYNYSENANCRFFVVIYDDTADFEKPLYKHLLRTVESHFYKRNASGLVPF